MFPEILAESAWFLSAAAARDARAAKVLSWELLAADCSTLTVWREIRVDRLSSRREV